MSLNEIGCKTGVDMRAAMLLGELLASLNAHQLDLLAETLDRLHPNPAGSPDPDEMESGERRKRKEKLTFAKCGIPIGSTLEFDDPRAPTWLRLSRPWTNATTFGWATRC